MNISRSLQDAIQELWGMGFTLASRKNEYELLNEKLTPPEGMSYQWNATGDEINGWHPVYTDRHPGVFAPFFSKIEIRCGGLWLMERAIELTEAAHEANRAKALKQVDDLFAKMAEQGIGGSVTTLTESSSGFRQAEIAEIGETGSARTKIPLDMLDHLKELMAERDRLVEESLTKSPTAFDIVGMRTVCLETAIENIRKKYAKGDTNG